jgi:2-aminoethylphosphonate-pyruvate transaminase
MATNQSIAGHRARLLLNPGPVTLSQRVREALLRPDLCHREPEYSALQQSVRRRLSRAYREAENDYETVLITGSGTAAVEAMVGSLVPPSGNVLVLANGIYGERIARMLSLQSKQFQMLQSDWLQPIDLDLVEQTLASATFSHVVAVHHETTTGRLNDAARLVRLCEQRGIQLLLDAVSSFAGEWIEFLPSLTACAATANKCVHGVPGVSFVLARRDVLQSAESNCPSLYLDLIANYRAQADGYPLFTPSVQAMYALDAALDELESAGGWRERNNQYRQRSKLLRDSLCAGGFELLLGCEAAYSSLLTSFRLPQGITFGHLYAPLEKHGFIIYPGQKSLQQQIFRVAVMGDLHLDDIRAFANAVISIVRI